jgi:hypothetical protein
MDWFILTQFSAAGPLYGETRRSEACPSCRLCGSGNLSRSRTRWFEQWLKPLRTARPYRCRVCAWRGWL